MAKKVVTPKKQAAPKAEKPKVFITMKMEVTTTEFTKFSQIIDAYHGLDMAATSLLKGWNKTPRDLTAAGRAKLAAFAFALLQGIRSGALEAEVLRLLKMMGVNLADITIEKGAAPAPEVPHV